MQNKISHKKNTGGNKKPPAFTISGDSVSWPYVLKLKYKRKLTAYQIDRLFFRAAHYREWIRQERGIEVGLIPIIESGLKTGWIHLTTPLEEYNKPYLERWVSEHIYGKKAKKKIEAISIKREELPESIGEVLKTLI